MKEVTDPDTQKGITKDELLAKARKPGEDAKILHAFYRGKVEVVPRCCVRGFDDLAIWYTPGVAEPCKIIRDDRELSYALTSRWNTIAIISDGTRILGLGDIGPEAGLPVMEGKSLLFKYLGGVDAVPLCLGTKDPDKLIETVKYLQPSFGGINLEDISQPKCFYILDRLRNECEIPVWHDDQQGTATVVVAAAINASKLVGKKMDEMDVVLFGAGAANIAIGRVLRMAGVKMKNIVQIDSRGPLHPGRKDIEAEKDAFREKWILCEKSNGKGALTIEDAFRGADMVIAASKPGPDTIKKEWIRLMNDKPIVFATANPVPEIWPWDAKEAGAYIVATGRSDFPNQVNNSLGFPGIFRGTLDVKARGITDEMCISAAYELAETAENRGLTPDYILPRMDEWEVFPREAVAVGLKAIEQGLAREKPSRNELKERAESIISRARKLTGWMMKHGFIPSPPI